ncbi:MAG: ABC transporter ATP-binding protein [Alphaproteobacteria bacterium]|nr:ABC transporter ATP-binding protein [Alphaproteobacteria bacterium]
MAGVEVRGLCKAYGPVKALDDVSLVFEDGEFFALLGPSGSGKTTLLRAVAGFASLDAGEIMVGGEPIHNLPAHRRDLGMVFQNFALFPHMTVFENVAFGLSVRGEPSDEIARRVAAILELVRLSGMTERRPRQLSGGQQQRVALARALVTRPRVLLLDEPLGALDRRLRQQMQIELRQIQREVGITAIFVTHDQEEALTLSDRIALINDGKLVQVGTPHEVYERPATVFAAGFLGDANLFNGQVAGPGRITGKGFGALGTEGHLPAQGATAIVAVRPEKIELVPPNTPVDAGVNRIPGTVKQVVYSGNSVTYIVATEGRDLTVFAQNRAAEVNDPGTAVVAVFSPRHSVVVQP